MQKRCVGCPQGDGADPAYLRQDEVRARWEGLELGELKSASLRLRETERQRGREGRGKGLRRTESERESEGEWGRWAPSSEVAVLFCWNLIRSPFLGHRSSVQICNFAQGSIWNMQFDSSALCTHKAEYWSHSGINISKRSKDWVNWLALLWFVTGSHEIHWNSICLYKKNQSSVTRHCPNFTTHWNLLDSSAKPVLQEW